ncbi:GNAT family N-acetyltransferase [Paucisalibacillus globulus]|uniref:GNAT family N-acetyltransferase n=1 Tax=Paucisalibacillus globulus TaxID=351095 RepID=UPI000405FCA2|nr:GNAT family N-acetyltransferase [Paucisalibacillus globulus]
MKSVKLVPHVTKFAEAMSSLTSSPHVKEALGLTDEQTSLEGTKKFIEFIGEQEEVGKQYSRCILDEQDQLIGVITLKDIDKVKSTCHIGTWIGHRFWGQGYNELAKAEILHTAFSVLNVDYVFAGAKVSNVRSQKAQEKLPYMRLDVGSEFPEEHRKLEVQVKTDCILNVIEKNEFLSWYKQNTV